MKTRHLDKNELLAFEKHKYSKMIDLNTKRWMWLQKNKSRFWIMYNFKNYL